MIEGQPEQPVGVLRRYIREWAMSLPEHPRWKWLRDEMLEVAGAAADDSAQPPLEDETRVRLQRTGSVALCEWQKKLPDESGLWWWWNEDEDSTPISKNRNNKPNDTRTKLIHRSIPRDGKRRTRERPQQRLLD